MSATGKDELSGNVSSLLIWSDNLSVPMPWISSLLLPSALLSPPPSMGFTGQQQSWLKQQILCCWWLRFRRSRRNPFTFSQTSVSSTRGFLQQGHSVLARRSNQSHIQLWWKRWRHVLEIKTSLKFSYSIKQILQVCTSIESLSIPAGVLSVA